MESYSCNIAIGGDRGMIVRKGGLSVAEVIMLRFIHGDSSVESIEPAGKMDASQATREHLSEIYGGEKVANVFGPYGDLPTKIGEAKIPETFFSQPKNKGGRPKKKAPAKKVSVTAEVSKDESASDE